MLPTLALGLLDQPVEPSQFLTHRADLQVDRGLGATELLGATPAFGGEHLVLHPEELLDRKLLGCRRLTADPRRARDEDEHDEQPDHDHTQQRHDEFHVENATTGV